MDTMLPRQQVEPPHSFPFPALPSPHLPVAMIESQGFLDDEVSSKRPVGGLES
jgi:hypothetical protein